MVVGHESSGDRGSVESAYTSGGARSIGWNRDVDTVAVTYLTSSGVRQTAAVAGVANRRPPKRTTRRNL